MENSIDVSTLLRFDSPKDFSSRRAYQAEIDSSVHQLERILGGYSFGKDNYTQCGLKGCRTLHGKGYVVQTLDGIETNIGKDCGTRHFGQRFEDLEGQFTRLVEESARRDRVQDAIRQKDATVQKTVTLLKDCRSWEAEVDRLFKELDRESSLISVLRAAMRTDGALVVDRQLSAAERELSGGSQRYIRETVGRLYGLSVLGMKKVSIELQAEALVPLHELSDDQLSAMSASAIRTKAQWLSELEATLLRAESYIRSAREFCSQQNWRTFSQAFDAGRHKTTDRGRAILKRLAQQTPV
ncbi:MAG: hypothetical protein PSV40_17500 [Polaromonas sp.]|uniref:hypothetical protein n=1 Tax=Polaromonas sp. TaxID=1869339 RepID=UPI00248725F9|nr:hypothetical protein [Polaromonas sp.]MDI1270881.1 hypothetical protein [Polaromonas sp.]